MNELTGLYGGIVEDTGDPLKMGRLRCRVPVVYGTVTGNEADGSAITTNDLPWALPMGLPAGATNKSGMIGWLPTVGDHVYVQFLDGEPEKPVWTWGGQDTTQVSGIGGWSRDPGGYTDASPSSTAPTITEDASGDLNTSTKAPASAFLSRYGHLMDFQEDSLTLRTANGYLLRFTDSTQQLDIYAPNMMGLVGALKFTGQDYQFNPANTFKVNTGDATISGNNVELNALINNLSAVVNKINSPLVLLGPESQANGPVIRAGDLATVLNLLIAYYDTHTHTGNLGFPTSPPIIPIVTLPITASTTTFSA
jgi:hypothetical protein